jgi:D-alanine-D-alanine ligase
MKRETIAILFPNIKADASPDEKDVLLQAAAVRSALRRLGWRTEDLEVTLDLAALSAELRRVSPRLVFNLVEALEGKGRLIALIPNLLESLGIPFSGAATEAIFLSSNKLLAKTVLCNGGIRTLPWCTASRVSEGGAPPFPPPYIVKQVWEHASLGMDDGAVAMSVEALRARCGRDEEAFVEPYIEGREFNISVLGGTGNPREPQALPPAEIEFIEYPEGKPKVVSYNAKWIEGSFEFDHTPRTFEFSEADGPFLGELRKISLECWRLFGLRGYARVDFRVDRSGTPFVLEVNANPCISPDSGFISAAAQAGLNMDEVVRRIVSDTMGVKKP